MKPALLLLVVSLAACAPGKDAAVRDVRPTKVELGDKLVIEGSGAVFAVGAPTTVTLDRIRSVNGGQPLVLPARAVSPDRVVADIDERVEAACDGRHVFGDSPVTVYQTIDGKTVGPLQSDARDPFAFDLFPRNLQHVAQGAVRRISGNEVLDWLGMKVQPTAGGLKVTWLQQRFDPKSVGKYDRPPLDGKITKEEARVGQPDGMSAAEWSHLHDGKKLDEPLEYLALEERAEKEETNGLAAAAGMQVGDIIVKANGQPVATAAQLEKVWIARSDKVATELLRGNVPAMVDLPRAGAPAPFPSWIIFALALAIAAGIVAAPVPVIAGLIVVWERKVSAYMQSRIGPNRVGPNGWLQWLADGLKLIMKEDIIPTEADPYLFRMSPYLAFIGAFLTLMVLPFSHFLIVADLNIGLLFLLSVTSLVVVSIIMGGWSSNSKWALLGGMRSAAQIISYELPASVALLTIATLTGSLSTQKIVEAQGGWPWDWFLFRNPFTFAAFFIYFTSALAEGNRTPFDLPEAESELVSGYNTEYSGFRFSLFPMVEWVNLFIIGAVATLLFLGGWNVPFVDAAMLDKHWALDLIGFALFLAKDIFIIFVIIWIRWTLPRFRVDQMMNLCWKYFIPISFAGFVGILLWAWLVPPILAMAVKFVMFGMFCLFATWFIGRVRYNSVRYTDLVINEPLGRTNA